MTTDPPTSANAKPDYLGSCVGYLSEILPKRIPRNQVADIANSLGLDIHAYTQRDQRDDGWVWWVQRGEHDPDFDFPSGTPPEPKSPVGYVRALTSGHAHTSIGAKRRARRQLRRIVRKEIRKVSPPKRRPREVVL